MPIPLPLSLPLLIASLLPYLQAFPPHTTFPPLLLSCGHVASNFIFNFTGEKYTGIYTRSVVYTCCTDSFFYNFYINILSRILQLTSLVESTMIFPTPPVETYNSTDLWLVAEEGLVHLHHDPRTTKDDWGAQ